LPKLDPAEGVKDRSCPEALVSGPQNRTIPQQRRKCLYEERRRGTRAVAVIYPYHPWHARQITQLQKHLYSFGKIARPNWCDREAVIDVKGAVTTSEVSSEVDLATRGGLSVPAAEVWI
jgi:hypothetical protein